MVALPSRTHLTEAPLAHQTVRERRKPPRREGVRRRHRISSRGIEGEFAGMEVIVVLRDEPAVTLQSPAGSAESLPGPLRQLIKRRSLGMSQVYPTATDPELRVYYRIDVGSAPEAEQLISELLECEGVDGAYLKPGTEPA